ncbi:hypothetical protein CASFOL_026009 [Castilleja foliolosa]|uniref:NAC domain-containing protein n=1 Tax=Castilleja foliolosa TaxID=1961234 RepID=A0ABD3CWJ0_9LAMI
MATYPLGFRFHPSEEEMMKYLLQKVTQTLPCNVDNFIGTADLYGHKEPWDIFGGDSEDKERYFFTELKKVGKKKPGQRISRNVGDGYWSNKGQKSPIYGTNREGLVGYKRCFRYESKNDDNDRSGIWLLKEYVLADNVKRRVKEEFQDYALCVLKRKEKGRGSSGRNNDRQEDVELEDFMESILNNNTCTSIAAPADPMVKLRDDDSMPIDDDWIMKVFDYDDRQEDMMLAVAPPSI